MDKRDIEKGLIAKGFKRIDKGHRYFIYYTIDGKKTRVKTMTSHSPQHKQIGMHLLSQMARQCEVEKKIFLDLINCPFSREDYEAYLLENNKI